MEQPKKPGGAGAPPQKDITDLKARLGLRPAGPPGAGPQPGGFPGGRPPGQGAPPPGGAPAGFPGAGRPTAAVPAGAMPPPGYQQAGMPPAAAAPPPGMAMGMGAPVPAAAPAAAPNPFANMRPQQGAAFDLRSIDDGAPVQKVKSGAGKAVIIASVVVGGIAFALGAGLGISSVGRANMNSANEAAKRINRELDGMQKTVSQIATAFAMSQARLVKDHKDPFSYDKELTKALDAVKLDPRPGTSNIFRVDYYRLSDIVVDRLFNYYNDTILLYGDIERHIRRTKNDAAKLEEFAAKESGKLNKNYGVIFDQEGKVPIAKLVEVTPCPPDDKNCQTDKLDFLARLDTSGKPFVRRVALKSEGMIPIKRTDLMDAVMSGSPDQVRAESYRKRVESMRETLGRLNSEQKELLENVKKAAERPDTFAPFKIVWGSGDTTAAK